MKPWLILPPQVAHDLAPYALQVLAGFREKTTYTWRPFTWRGLSFANRLGTAGGIDKDGELIEEWWKFGPGFVEVGTITPKAQTANPGKIIARDLEERAIWNRMGFPGGGIDHARANLKDLPSPRHTPVFVNIGRNRTTPNEYAGDDYATCIEELTGLADVFVVNISSPNTTGLRELLMPANLRSFLGGVLAARNRSGHESFKRRTPILLKLSPDLSQSDLESVIEIAVGLGVDGFVATNTTLARYPGSHFPTDGGVSGAPLATRSKEVLKQLVQILGSSRSDKLIVSTGGVMTPEDVLERLDLGADLVQTYTALIYEGPGFFGNVAKYMSLNPS